MKNSNESYTETLKGKEVDVFPIMCKIGRISKITQGDAKGQIDYFPNEQEFANSGQCYTCHK